MNLEKLKGGIFGGSLVLMITINLYFALNYFFHFAMARMLPIAEYGVLVTLYSFIYFSGMFTESIQVILSKYSTHEKDPGKLKNVIMKTFKKASKFALLILIIFLIAGVVLSRLLDVEYGLIALTGVVVFVMFLLPINRGIMQGRKKFGVLGVNMILESGVKFLLAVGLVYIGWAVYGAMVATFIALAIAIIASFGSLKEIFKSKQKEADTKGIYGYTAPVFVATMAVIAFYSIDVIMVKIFFDAEITGAYAIASTLSKVIFFGTQPISKAMFPLASESKSKKDSGKIMLSSVGMLSFCIAVSLAVIFFFPDLLIKIFSGRSIPEITSLLIYPAIAVGLISFANLSLLHKLSKGGIKNYYLLLVFVLIEIVLMSVFNDSLLEFSIAYITASSIFLWGVVFLIKSKDE